MRRDSEERKRARMMAFVALLVFILSLSVNHKVIDLVVTGFASAVVSLTVEENPDVLITHFTYPSSVVVNNQMSFSVGFRNVGNVNITEDTRIYIKTTGLETIATLSDATFNMSRNETRTFDTVYTPTSGGTFYAVVIVNYSSRTTETNATFTVTVPATAAPSGPSYSEAVTVSNATPSKTFTARIEETDKLRVQEITVETKVALQDVRVTVREAKLPGWMSAPITEEMGSVLKYLDVLKSNVRDEDIAKVRIKFKVEKTWINSNNVLKDTVSLQRFEKEWKKLPTIKKSEDSGFVYYEAESPGLSLFAITGERNILILDYPEYVKLNRGQSSLVQILARNEGNLSLNNLKLSVSDSDLSLRTSPDSLRLLPPKSSFIFLMTVDVGNTSVSPHAVDFTLSSDELERKGRILFEIELQKIETEVGQSIRNYGSQLESLAVQTDRAAKEGKDVKPVLESLNQAGTELDTAKQLHASQDFAGAKERLENVRKLMEQATLQLAKAVMPPIVFMRPEIMAAAAGIIILLVLYFYGKRRNHKR